MPYGYNGKILHVNLTTGTMEVEEPEERFYRTYLGGSAMGAYYLLKHTPPGTEPLAPANTLSLMASVLTGAPVSGQCRVAATAKSPLTGLIGESASGGFWPAELKFAGFDGIVLRGRAEQPVYLWVCDGEAELRDAAHLWGRFTADVEDAIRADHGDERIHVLQCGPAAERGVRFSGLISNANRANARAGLGLVMASKNLKAVAVRGRQRPPLADPEGLRSLAKWGAQNLSDSGVAGHPFLGTSAAVLAQNSVGGLPTHNWSSGVFDGAEAISGQRMAETIRTKGDTCYACVVRCKPVVEVDHGPYRVDARYGGPEYESLSALGSYCGVSDLEAVAYANQLCNMYGMDTISCGATIAWAMDCYEQGLLTQDDTGGVDLTFGNAAALVHMIEQIGERQGLGHILAEGSMRAAQELGVGHDLVVAVKGQELPAHMPQVKRGLGFLYTTYPGGADHTIMEHDPGYVGFPQRMAELGLMNPVRADVLNEEKVRYAVYSQRLISCVDSLCMCKFVYGPAWQLYGPGQMVDVVRAATGWNISLWELMKAGERRLALMRAFNSREGVGKEADTVPPKLYVPLQGGPTDGVAVTPEEMDTAQQLYYDMLGWDEKGHPKRSKLVELGLGWLADELGA